MTERQADVLGVLSDGKTYTPSEIGEYHLPIGLSSARAALDGLERRKYVSAVYTGTHRRGRSYEITDAGTEALLKHDEEVQS
jgi:DNA-binding PadR family transcriptional regulator